MSSSHLIFWTCLILTVILIDNVHSIPRRIPQPRRRAETDETSESGESSYEYLEVGNPNDRGLGFGKNKNASSGSKYPFPATPEPSYTQQPEMFKRLQAKGYNDIEDVDKDYYAHYDFEFAKSGIVRANFEQKYLNNQAKHIGKPLVNPNAPPPSAADDSFGGFAAKPGMSKGEKDARSLLAGGGLLGLGGTGMDKGINL